MRMAFILLMSWIMAAPLALAREQGTVMQTFDSYMGTGYNQRHRPQFHFTSMQNWLNDPNGMLYYDGEYHLFFQHNPKALPWGNMTWGHAVSPDMIHWKQLPHAIMPYDGGTIFSGTAVVDHNNSLGKQKGDIKTLVACFSFARKPFYQAMAYSTDKGRTFSLLNDGKAVVPNQGFNGSERDPKIFWHEPTKKWVMVLWVHRGTPGRVRFFTSSNLRKWTKASDFQRDWLFECMDLVQLTVDGDPNNKKWLLYDASFEYEIGDFDGKTFTTDKRVGKGDYGKNYYAAQTFNNSPDGRTVIIGWMRGSDFSKEGMPFNQQMSIPTTMELRTTPNGLHLFRWPVKEIESLYTKTHEFRNLTVTKTDKLLRKIKATLIDLSIEFDPAKAGDVELNIRGLKVTYDHSKSQFFYNGSGLVSVLVGGRAYLRVLVDRGSIELFAINGATVASHYALPSPSNKKITISSDRDGIIASLVVNVMKSIW